MQFSRFGTAALALSALALVSAQTAHAQTPVTINFSLAAFSSGSVDANGNDFSLSDHTGTVTLLPGQTKKVNIQSIVFDVQATSNFVGNTQGTVTRTITIAGISQNATQLFNLDSEFPGDPSLLAADSLTFNPGTKVTFNLGSQGLLDFTPTVLDTGSFFNEDQGSYQSNDQGTFTLRTAPAPEPSQFAALGLGVIGLGALGLRARRRATPVA